MESQSRQKELRKVPIPPRRMPILSGLKFRYLGDGQTMDRPSSLSVHVAVKRGNPLKRLNEGMRLRRRAASGHDGRVMELLMHICISPWFATPRSLLAAVFFVLKKKKMGVGVAF
jgi:hypothetical protein